MLAPILALILTQAPISVTAKQLVAAYAKNEIGADSKFKDKSVRVTGAVFAVGKIKTGDFFVALYTIERLGGSYSASWPPKTLTWAISRRTRQLRLRVPS